MASSSDTKALYRFIRFISSLAVDTFFTEVRVIGGENVPKDGPIIVYVFLCSFCGNGVPISQFRTATHHNMMLDPVILCTRFASFTALTRVLNSLNVAVGFPYQRTLNYWSKGTSFLNETHLIYSSPFVSESFWSSCNALDSVLFWQHPSGPQVEG